MRRGPADGHTPAETPSGQSQTADWEQEWNRFERGVALSDAAASQAALCDRWIGLRRRKKCVIYVCSLAGLVLLICIFIFKFKFLLNHGFSPKYISRAGPLALFSALIADTDAVKLYLKLKTFLNTLHENGILQFNCYQYVRLLQSYE